MWWGWSRWWWSAETGGFKTDDYDWCEVGTCQLTKVIYIYRSSFWDAVHCAHRNYASANMGGLYHIGRPYAFVTFMHILMSFIEKRKSLQLLYQFLVEPLEFLLIGCCLGFAYSMGSLRKCKFVIWRWTFNVCIYIFMKFSMEKWVSFLFGQAARDWRWSFNV